MNWKFWEKPKLKTYRVRIYRHDFRGWIEVLAVNEEEALLMRQYLQYEEFEA